MKLLETELHGIFVSYARLVCTKGATQFLKKQTFMHSILLLLALVYLLISFGTNNISSVYPSIFNK